MIFGISLKIIILVLLALICIAVIVGIIYFILILVEIRKTARLVNKLVNDDLGTSLQSISNLIARVDRISGLFLNKLDLMAEGSQKVNSVLKAFMKSPLVETKSLLAGIKRGLEVLLRGGERKC